MSLTLENVAKRYSGPGQEKVGAVRSLSLTVADGEFLVIVGPSGCGKTTTLRLIAGLETPDVGEIRLGGRSMTGVAPKDRDVAMVFQHHALLPHLSVFDNLAFGLTLRRMAREEIGRRVREAAAMLRLENLLLRKPGALSGGECQRVALGRALVRQPRVFLFDEPLSDLDAPMRLQLRGEIAAVHRRSGAMMVYVTHDQAEAMALADRIAVMREGALQQAGPPMELYRRPVNRFVAGFIGSPPMNFFEGRLQRNGGAAEFFSSLGGWSVTIPPEWHTGADRTVTLGLRPEHVVLDPSGEVHAQLERVERGGPENLLYLSAGRSAFVARAGVDGVPSIGQSVALRFDLREAVLFNPDTGHAIATSGKLAC